MPRLRITYVARGTDAATDREVSPLRLVHYRELIMDILKHGAHCEVLGPPALRLAVAKEVRQMGQKYF